MASQKSGTETPIWLTTVAIRSLTDRGRSAESGPAGRRSAAPRSIAANASDSVAGSRSSDQRGDRFAAAEADPEVTGERPPAQLKYCSPAAGRARCAPAARRRPPASSACPGPPGPGRPATRCISEKTTHADARQHDQRLAGPAGAGSRSGQLHVVEADRAVGPDLVAAEPGHPGLHDVGVVEVDVAGVVDDDLRGLVVELLAGLLVGLGRGLGRAAGRPRGCCSSGSCSSRR